MTSDLKKKATLLNGAAFYLFEWVTQLVDIEVVLKRDVLRNAATVLLSWSELYVPRRCYRAFRQTIG